MSNKYLKTAIFIAACIVALAFLPKALETLADAGPLVTILLIGIILIGAFQSIGKWWPRVRAAANVNRERYEEIAQYKPRTLTYFILSAFFWVAAAVCLLALALVTAPQAKIHGESDMAQAVYIMGQAIGLGSMVLPFWAVREYYRRWHKHKFGACKDQSVKYSKKAT